MLSRREFLRKASAVPLIGTVGAVTGALIAKSENAEADPMLLNLADNSNGAWAEASSWNPGFEPYWAVITPSNQRSWYNGACWASAATPTKTTPQSLTVHLGGGIPNLSRICIYSVQNNYTNPDPYPPNVTAGTYPHASYFAIKDFTIEAFDGLSWHIVATVTGNDSAKRCIDFTTPVRTTTLRIQVTATQPYTQLAMIVGVEAWGTTDYVDLTNKYNVISTSAAGASGMLEQYDSLSAANAAANDLASRNTAVYGVLAPTLSVQAATRPRMIDSNFRSHPQEFIDESLGGAWVDNGGASFSFDYGNSGLTNQDFQTVTNQLDQIQKDLVDDRLRLVVAGGALSALLGAFLVIPPLVIYGSTIVGAGVFALGRDANMGGTDMSIVPNAWGGFSLYHPFEP